MKSRFEPISRDLLPQLSTYVLPYVKPYFKARYGTVPKIYADSTKSKFDRVCVNVWEFSHVSKHFFKPEWAVKNKINEGHAKRQSIIPVIIGGRPSPDDPYTMCMPSNGHPVGEVSSIIRSNNAICMFHELYVGLPVIIIDSMERIRGIRFEHLKDRTTFETAFHHVPDTYKQKGNTI